ncbi:MAG: hypothetical protein ACFE9N_08230 [Promethearchaeota archaeon]
MLKFKVHKSKDISILPLFIGIVFIFGIYITPPENLLALFMLMSDNPVIEGVIPVDIPLVFQP